MGLSRRQLTKEFKPAAIERLEKGASIAEVSRAFEVNPNVLYRWRREFRQGAAAPRGRLGASLRSRRPIRQPRLHPTGPGARHSDQHVAQGQSLEQRGVRVVHQDAEIRRGLPHRISQPGRGPQGHRHVSGKGLQPLTPALGARPLAADRVRAQRAGSKPAGGRCAPWFFMSFLRPGEIYHFDEFPAGYSLAGCSPAEPACASPAGGHLAGKPARCTIKFQRTARSILIVCLSPRDNRNPWVYKRI